jgi:hypothetical protein
MAYTLDRLHERLQRSADGLYALHIGRRLTVVLAGEGIEYAEVVKTTADRLATRDRLTFEMVMFTTTRVVRVEATDSPYVPSVSLELSGSTVSVTSWPRRDLDRLEITPFPPGGDCLNDDQSWGSEAADVGDLPPDCVVTLGYLASVELLHLPLNTKAPRSERDDLIAFLPSLARDMASP